MSSQLPLPQCFPQHVERRDEGFMLLHTKCVSEIFNFNVLYRTHGCPPCCPEELRFMCSPLEDWLQLLVEALGHEMLNRTEQNRKLLLSLYTVQ